MIIENKTNSITGVRNEAGNVLTLMPGGNQVDESTYKSMKSELEFLESSKKAVVWKTKEEFDARGKAKEQKLAASLKDLDAKNAEALIAETVDGKTLQAWKDAETRDSVRLAISKRIDEIEKYSASDS
jgi:hypothetical protein